MAKKKILFNNDLNEDDYNVYDNYEDAERQSIQQSLWDLKNIIVDDRGGAIDVDDDTDLDAIETACRNYLKAIRGKFVSKYLLEEA